MDKENVRMERNVKEAYLQFVKEQRCPVVIEGSVRKHMQSRLEGIGSGIYIQLRSTGEVYIGEAVDVLKRQREHLQNGVELRALAVTPFASPNLQLRYAFETDMIARALERGFRLANGQKVAQAQELVARRKREALRDFEWELDAWGRKMVDEWGTDGWLVRLQHMKRTVSPEDIGRYRAFMAAPEAHEMLLLLNRFIRRVIPQPEATYGRAWSIELAADEGPRSDWIALKTRAGTMLTVGVREGRCVARLLGDTEVGLEDAEWLESKALWELLLERSVCPAVEGRPFRADGVEMLFVL